MLWWLASNKVDDELVLQGHRGRERESEESSRRRIDLSGECEHIGTIDRLIVSVVVVFRNLRREVYPITRHALSTSAEASAHLDNIDEASAERKPD